MADVRLRPLRLVAGRAAAGRAACAVLALATLALAGCGAPAASEAPGGTVAPSSAASGETVASSTTPGGTLASSESPGGTLASSSKAPGGTLASPSAAPGKTAAPSSAVAEPAPRSAEAFRDAEAASPAEYLREPRYATADFQRGELLAYACKACHALDPGEHNDLGPNLHGVIGRRAASLEDFEYSEALAGSGIVWVPEAIETWLAEPAAFVPGTKMKFTGFQSASDRRDVVAYLLHHTSGSADASSGAERRVPAGGG